MKITYYQLWGPDDMVVGPVVDSVDVAVRQACRFVAQYQDRGYYRDARGRNLTLMEVAHQMRVVILEEDPSNELHVEEEVV